MSIQQTNPRRRAALYEYFQNLFYRLGTHIQLHPHAFFILGVLFFAFCSYFCVGVAIETDSFKLWIQKNGRLNQEFETLSRIKAEFYLQSNVTIPSKNHREYAESEIPSGPALGGNFQVLIQTPHDHEANILNKKALLQHVKIMEEIVRYRIEMFGENWTLADVCFKPPGIHPPLDDLNVVIQRLLEKMVPCIWITPIDCFWEGVKPLGPNRPLEIDSMLSSYAHLPQGNFTWKNSDYGKLVKDLSKRLRLNQVAEFFEKSGAESSYLKRPCINPLDPECPSTSPNYYFNSCKAFQKFMAWNKTLPENERIFLTGDAGVKNDSCSKFRKSFLEWMDADPTKWKLFLVEEEFPVHPDYAHGISYGCRGFAQYTMKLPEELIFGGVKRYGFEVTKASALQTVFLLAEPSDLYQRFRDSENKPKLNRRAFSVNSAHRLIQAWQRHFTDRVNKAKNQGSHVFHALSSTSMSDTLENYSHFNFTLIIIAYGLVSLYAIFSYARWDGCWFSSESGCGTAIVGVLLVGFSSIASIGFSFLFGISLNALTMQVIPFISLGIGIDYMLLLLHSYNKVLKQEKANEIAILMQESGLSILVTSINAILAFLIGATLPVPGIRSFCLHGAILLTFNMLSNMYVFPGFIGMDLKRRKAGQRDLSYACCCLAAVKPETDQEANQLMTGTENTQEEPESKYYTLNGFLHTVYIPWYKKASSKLTVVVLCNAVFYVGLLGSCGLRIGLDLTDFVPNDIAATLNAYEKYFGSYPMFLIPNGPLIDYPNQQTQLEKLRHEIGRSEFIVKFHGQPSPPDWLQLMRRWLASLQRSYLEGIEYGILSYNDTLMLDVPNVTDNMRFARRLICSYGNEFNCVERLGRVFLVDENEIINPEGFYNYLTAWYNSDHMTYYISQADFFPTPPKWIFNPKDDGLIPAASPLLYSRLPFYSTGLSDTPKIVKMIKEIRGICDRYTRDGLTVFPTGTAFTFWEQFLHLDWYLLILIASVFTVILLLVSLIVCNVCVTAIMAVVLLTIMVEFVGFMCLLGLKLNPISGILLVASFGISAEFASSVVIAFQNSSGTRKQRMFTCMERLFEPFVRGGLSTLLSLTVLAFSELGFVVKYVFVMISVFTIIAVINGLVLLPILLSLVWPTDDSVGCWEYWSWPAIEKAHVNSESEYEDEYENKSDGEVSHVYHETLATIYEETSSVMSVDIEIEDIPGPSYRT